MKPSAKEQATLDFLKGVITQTEYARRIEQSKQNSNYEFKRTILKWYREGKIAFNV